MPQIYGIISLSLSLSSSDFFSRAVSTSSIREAYLPVLALRRCAGSTTTVDFAKVISTKQSSLKVLRRYCQKPYVQIAGECYDRVLLYQKFYQERPLLRDDFPTCTYIVLLLTHPLPIHTTTKSNINPPPPPLTRAEKGTSTYREPSKQSK